MNSLIAYRLNRFGTRYGRSHLVVFHLVFVHKNFTVRISENIWPGSGFLNWDQRLGYCLCWWRGRFGWLSFVRWWRWTVHTSSRLSSVRGIFRLKVRIQFPPLLKNKYAKILIIYIFNDIKYEKFISTSIFIIFIIF